MFFQAVNGKREYCVTGVETCALSRCGVCVCVCLWVCVCVFERSARVAYKIIQYVVAVCVCRCVCVCVCVVDRAAGVVSEIVQFVVGVWVL